MSLEQAFIRATLVIVVDSPVQRTVGSAAGGRGTSRPYRVDEARDRRHLEGTLPTTCVKPLPEILAQPALVVARVDSSGKHRASGIDERSEMLGKLVRA